jgi:surface polysaccharide O-acyltransferase-like enzyme
MNWFELIRWNTVTVYQSIGRLGVPLFLLLTGALLLQPSKLTEPVGVFFKKRLARIGLPFIFWGAIYFVWDFLVVNKINGQPITTNSIIQGVLTGPYYQFWYLYLLLGLYLITPILRVVMANASRDLIKYILILWFLGAAIVPTIALVTPLHLDTNVLTITGYVGYFILGAYLLTVQLSRSRLALYTAVGITLTAIGTYVIAATVGGGEMYFFQGYLSPTLILAACSLFLLLIAFRSPSAQAFAPLASPGNNLNLKEICSEGPCKSKGSKLLRLISVNTLPLYLFHVMVLETIQHGYLGFAINGNTINSIIGVPLNTVIVLFVSLGIIVGLKKVPYLKSLVG